MYLTFTCHHNKARTALPEDLGVNTCSDLQGDCLGTHGVLVVVTELVLNPQREWCLWLGGLVWLNKNVFALAGESKVTTVECFVVRVSGHNAATCAFCGCARPTSSGCACAGNNSWNGTTVKNKQDCETLKSH